MASRKRSKTIPFYKMVGAGNDFVVIDNRQGVVGGSKSKLAAQVCDRHRSVGADGLLLLERSNRAQFKMVYYNSDGSEASMCGNGARCIARFAQIKGVIKDRGRFETRAGIYGAELDPKKVELSMPPVIKHSLNIKVKALGKNLTAHWMDTGVPHAVVMVKNVAAVNLQEMGRALRFHKAFGPAGSNVDFVERSSSSKIIMRTYERGVEGETLACGTGAVASACVSALVLGTKAPVSVKTQSGLDLVVSFKRIGSMFDAVTLTGEARAICEGVIYLN